MKTPLLKVALSRKGLWKYTLFQIFINFSSKFLLWLAGFEFKLLPSANQKLCKNNLRKIGASEYLHKPYWEKATFTKEWFPSHFHLHNYTRLSIEEVQCSKNVMQVKVGKTVNVLGKSHNILLFHLLPFISVFFLSNAFII